MAVILGTKPVIDTEQFNNYALGITLPLQSGGNYFKQSYTSIEAAKTNIKSLLLTKRGERLMQPFLGSGLGELVFDFNDDELATTIEDTINEAIERWLPYINVDEIEVEQTDTLKDENRINVSVKFSIGESINTSEVTFTV